jgi:hypothetical protein
VFAVDHAATALLVKRRYPSVGMPALLISVQAMELAWVAFNFLGVERTTTEATVESVADIHLVYMPYSHSVATAIGSALLAWLIIARALGRPLAGRAVGIGIVSHLVLDLVTHAPDIALSPAPGSTMLGLGLYERAPMVGFAVELAYGVFCWYLFRGGQALFWVVVLGNLANLSFFSSAIPGPERYLAGHPQLVVTVVFIQIVATFLLVGVLADSRRQPT